MKSTLRIFAVLAFLGLFFIPSVAALATSQGLEWGIALGSKATYTLDANSGTLVTSESIFINVTAMPASAIHDPLTTWASIPEPTLGFWWANDTSMGFLALIFLGVYATGGKFTVPVGNFTLLQSLLAPVITGETFSTPDNLWQVVWTTSINATAETRITSAFSTVDGFLSTYKLETWNTATNTLADYIHVTRTNLPSAGLDIVKFVQDNMLLVAGAVVVIIILGVVCAKRK
jgi:hypothetical protein